MQVMLVPSDQAWAAHLATCADKTGVNLAFRADLSC